MYLKSFCVLQDHYDDERDKTVFHNTTPYMQDQGQDQDGFFFGLRPEVVGSNLSPGYFALRSTQPSNPPRSVNEYRLRLGRQRQVWLIPIADERVGVQVKL